ncbi:hypothetical protein ACFOW4_10415 [Micromonospora sp. GCM10011542]|uniref:hypothetical protein n=1 Tax=Micromonospora sp. GCM10011542 TaxID=3317337 RepID=UPI00361208F9
MTNQPNLDLIFWSGSVRTKPSVEHVRAAQAGGFTSMPIAADTHRAAIDSGLSPQVVIGMTEDAGAPIRRFEAFTDWAPIDLAAGGGALKDKSDVAGRDSFAIAERLGVRLPGPAGRRTHRADPGRRWRPGRRRAPGESPRRCATPGHTAEQVRR